jgi:hypothetical protein
LRKFFILHSPGEKGGGPPSAAPLSLLLIFRRRIQAVNLAILADIGELGYHRRPATSMMAQL